MAEKLANFIGGRLARPESGEYIESVNPATGQVDSLVPQSGQADLEAAVGAAEAAIPVWRSLGPNGRAEVLTRLAELLDDHAEELVRAEVDDNGMTRAFARGVEVPRGAANFRSFAQAALKFCEPQPFEASHARGYVRHQPVGVVGTISPWNLPLLSFTWKVAPALAAGNVVIAKPSEVTPRTAYLLTTYLNQAGFPAGVFNVLHGTGPAIGAPLAKHPSVQRLSFTGSTATGRAIGLVCAEAFKKPPMLEMGGKNPSLVFEDADMEKAVEGVKRAAFANQGQVCLCGSRIYVQSSIYKRFRDALVKATSAIRVGDPQDPNTEHGATISKAHMEKVLGYIQLASEEGGTLLCGGERATPAGRCSKGFFVQPTLFEGLPIDCRTNQEEIFGPVATLSPFEDEAEAIALANRSTYGLAATIWTEDMDRAFRVADALEAGMPWVNCWNLRVLETPFGGFKDSGNGHREGVPDAMEFFTEKKTVTMPRG